MTFDRALRTSASLRTLATLLIALAALLGLSAARASAAIVPQTYTGQAGGATPDIEQGGLVFNNASGGTIPSGGSAGTLNFTLGGTPRIGYCIDTSRVFNEGTELVETTEQDAPATAANRAVTWILLNRTPSGTPTPEKRTQAAVSQVAVWILVDGQINKTTPTNNAAINTAAAALVQEALAATANPASLALSATAPAAGATTSTVTVSGRAGATVALSVTAGTGTLSASQVVIGAGGTATVTLTSPQPGSVTIGATTAGDGRLILIDPTDPQLQSQATATAEPNQLSATLAVSFLATTPTTPTTPATPTVPGGVTGRPAPKLTIVKTAPASAKVLTRVRYRITVTNPGTVAVTNVVVTDRIPGGMSFAKATRTSTLSKGVLTFKLGRLAAGTSRSFYVFLVANGGVTGSRTNTATVSADRVTPRRASATTRFTAKIRRVQPAVTG